MESRTFEASRRSSSSHPLTALLIAGALLTTGTAHAFAEDVCFFYAPPAEGASTPTHVYYHPISCFDLECTDGPNGPCFSTGLKQYLGIVDGQGASMHVRSVLHYDVPYLYAGLLGLSQAQAQRLAAYGESVDLGEYRAMQKDPAAAGPQTATLLPPNPNIHGLVRTSETTPGFWAHFVPWYRPTGSSQTTSEVTPATYNMSYASQGKPSPLPVAERPLNQLRYWAFTPNAQLCRFGMADSQGACLSQKKLYYWLPYADQETGGVPGVEAELPTQWQEVYLNPQTNGYSAADAPALADTPAALAVYLHSLSDRISHHWCLDSVFIEPDTQTGDTIDYRLIYGNAACANVPHGLLHYEETGHEASTPARTRYAIELQLRELLDWAKRKNLTPLAPRVSGYYPASDPRFVDHIVNQVLWAVGRPCANQRLEALCQVAQAYGLPWHDGNQTCEYPTFPNDTQCQGP